MTRNRIVAVTAVLVLALAGFYLLRGAEAGEGSDFRTSAVERGDLESAVTATGALSAVTTVQVGTQVSGKVTEILADFNGRVRRGQLIARIDPTLQEQTVRDAEAGVARATAEVEQATRDHDRKRTLFERRVLTEAEFNTAQYTLAVARANLRSARVSLERARQNLAYTSIYAPIDGVVVERNVDVGQTVAASLSAPQLFLIANDLSRMQILASVDESDIGRIRDGQTVRFTVQAYPDESFEGTVRQVRLQSTTTENVVNYTVVVEVENRDGRLLPGMTASVDFLVETAKDVLMVPNAALRFRPSAELLAAAGVDTAAAARTGQPRTRGGAGAARGDSARAGARRAGAGSRGRIWVLENGTPRVVRVQTGISDGRRTVVSGPELREGMQVITGATDAGQAEGGTNPFQQPRTQGGPPGGRPGGF